MRWWLLGAAMAVTLGCERHQRGVKPSEAPSPSPVVSAPPETLEVTATVAAVTLADDCDGPEPPKNCVQTTMQLALSAGQQGVKGKLEVVRVELYDERTQKPLGELSARSPTVWSGAEYLPWNGVIEPGATLKTSWPLGAPDWTQLGGSRLDAAGRSFLVRVTLRVDGQETSADGVVKMPAKPKPKKVKIKSPPIIIEPPVVT